MGDLILMTLTANSKDVAAQALDVAKRLDRDGWIELMDYALLKRDETGHVTLREMSDESSEKVAAAVAGAAGGVLGTVFGLAGTATGIASGALLGAGSMRLAERLVPDQSLERIPDGLGADSSMLALVVEERHAERLDEALQKLGRTVRQNLTRAEQEAEFDAYLQQSKEKMRSIQDDIPGKSARAQSATGTEKLKIEAELIAARSELEAKREMVAAHIKEMNFALKSDIREARFRLELAGRTAKEGIATSIDHLYRQINRHNRELESLAQEQIESLKSRTSELKTKSAKAAGETKSAIQDHLLAVEFRLRLERFNLQHIFEERLLLTKQWIEDLHVRSALARADLRDKLDESIRAARHAYAELKAHVRMRSREDERAWNDIRQGFNKAWKDLEDAFDRANREWA